MNLVRQHFRLPRLCLLILCAVGDVLMAEEPQRTVYNHITEGGSQFDSLIASAFAGKFNMSEIGDSGYIRPKLTQGTLPKFCKAIDGSFLSGYVAVAYVVAHDGRTTDQVVIQTTDERLNTAALTTARDWRFVPARLQGSSIEIVAVQEFRFAQPSGNLTDQSPRTGGGDNPPQYLQLLAILDDQEIACEFDRSGPLLAHNGDITLAQPAFVARMGEFAYQFSFEARVNIERVLVEDVSGKNPVILVNESTAKPTDGNWMTLSERLELSKSGIPWIYERGDTMKIYRFTVTLSGLSEPIVLHQPVVWNLSAKKQLRKLAR